MCTRLPARGSPPCDAQHTLLYYHYIHAHLQYDIEILILLHTYRPTRAVEREIFLYVSYIFVAKNVDGALTLTRHGVISGSCEGGGGISRSPFLRSVRASQVIVEDADFCFSRSAREGRCLRSELALLRKPTTREASRSLSRCCLLEKRLGRFSSKRRRVLRSVRGASRVSSSRLEREARSMTSLY
jgi:hypothetical protein